MSYTWKDRSGLTIRVPLKFILIVGVDVDQQPGVYLSSDYFGATSEVAVMRPNRDLGILCKLCMQYDLRPVYHLLEVKAPAGGANGAKVSSKAKKKPCLNVQMQKCGSTVKYGGQGQAVFGPQQQQQLSKKQKEALLPSMKMCEQFKNYGCGKTSFFAGRACPGCTVTRDQFKEQEKTAKATRPRRLSWLMCGCTCSAKARTFSPAKPADAPKAAAPPVQPQGKPEPAKPADAPKAAGLRYANAWRRTK